MTEIDWKTLFEAFDQEEPFWESNYADEHDFEGLYLYKWLECEGTRPSKRMVKSFAVRGYAVFPVERDSSGWLVGGVRRHLDQSGKVITFG